jgi:ATP phosphoribosyltransferase
MADPIIIAVPKGRILAEADAAARAPASCPSRFRDEDSRALRFDHQPRIST